MKNIYLYAYEKDRFTFHPAGTTISIRFHSDPAIVFNLQITELNKGVIYIDPEQKRAGIDATRYIVFVVCFPLVGRK